MYIEVLIALALILNIYVSSEQVLQKAHLIYVEIEKKTRSEIGDYCVAVNKE